jgi:putative tricarboxylic transport membrane protein
MKSLSLRMTPEVTVLLVLAIAGGLGVLFIDALVAPPKLLFGRSLTAITPSLFPVIILSTMTALSILALILLRGTAGADRDAALTHGEWRRGFIFFAIMTFYALVMEPFGFLISSIMAMVLLSLQMGNRSVWQIALLSCLSPILLYLAATRLLAVSLPELNLIELAYARLLGE